MCSATTPRGGRPVGGLFVSYASVDDRLRETLAKCHQKRATGRIYVTGTVDGQTSSARLTTVEGRLVDVWLANSRSGEALSRLANLNIRSVTFIESAFVEPDIDPSLPSVEALLAAAEPKVSRAMAAKLGELLRGEAERIVAAVVGERASDQVAKAAARFPPAEQAVAFVAAIEALLEPYLGPKKAAELVAPVLASAKSLQ